MAAICSAGCGAMVAYAAVPGRPGARVPLEPFPDPEEGTVRVDNLRGRLVVLSSDQPSSKFTRRYKRHDCGGSPGPKQGALFGRS